MDIQIDSFNLNLNQQAQPNQNTYNEESFINLLQDLHSKSILYYCPYDHHSLSNFYHQILEHQQTQFLEFDVVHQFISELKQKNRMYIGLQIQYYQINLKEFVNNNIQAISSRQFHKIIDGCEQHSIMTLVFLQNLQNINFVSCTKLLSILKDAKSELQDAIIPQINITFLKTKRFNKSDIYDENGQNLDESIKPIFDQLEQYDIINLFTHYNSLTHRKLLYYKQFINDQQIRSNISTFQQSLKAMQQSIFQQINNMISTNTNLIQQSNKFKQIYSTIKSQEQLYNLMITKKDDQICNIKAQLNENILINEKFSKENTQLTQIINKYHKQITQLCTYCQTIELQLTDYKLKYNQIYKAYNKLQQNQQERSFLIKQENNNKVFINRSLKQQLQETNQRLNRILIDRERQKKIFKQKQQKNNDKIYLLQNHVDQLQRQLKLKVQNLHQYIRQSNVFNQNDLSFRKSKLLNRISYNNDLNFNKIPLIEQQDNNNKFVRESAIVKQVVSSRLSKQIKQLNIKQIELQMNGQQVKATFNKKPDYIHEIKKIQKNITKLYPDGNILQIIKEDAQQQQQSKQQSKNFKKNKKQPIQIKKIVIDENKILFFAKGLIINQSGIKFQTTIMITRKRFCLFNSKMRIQKYLPLETMSTIIFCVENPNLFVIKPHKQLKDSPNKNNKDSSFKINPKLITQDMILSSRQTNNFLQFCKSNHELLNKQYKIFIKIQEQINIYAKFEKQYNLKSKIPDINNIYRLSLAKQKVFYIQIKQQKAFFNDDYNAIAMIQPIGIICFKGNQIFQLQKEREFLFLLPTCIEMENNDKVQEKKIIEKGMKLLDRDPQKCKLTINYHGFHLTKMYTLIFRDSLEFSSFQQELDKNIHFKKIQKAKKMEEQRQLKKYYRKE